MTNRTKQVGLNRESTLPLLAGLNTDHQGRRIISLPLWACLQRLGQEGVQSRIRDNFIASEHLWMALNVFRNIRILVSDILLLGNVRFQKRFEVIILPVVNII